MCYWCGILFLYLDVDCLYGCLDLVVFVVIECLVVIRLRYWLLFVSGLLVLLVIVVCVFMVYYGWI